jgi:hypothetical protein
VDVAVLYGLSSLSVARCHSRFAKAGTAGSLIAGLVSAHQLTWSMAVSIVCRAKGVGMEEADDVVRKTYPRLRGEAAVPMGRAR